MPAADSNRKANEKSDKGSLLEPLPHLIRRAGPFLVLPFLLRGSAKSILGGGCDIGEEKSVESPPKFAPAIDTYLIGFIFRSIDVSRNESAAI